MFARELPGMTDAELQKIRGEFDTRLNSVLAPLAGKPFKPAEKRPPLGPGRGAYTRHYSYSVTDFAMKSFLLNEQWETANTALRDNAELYIGDKLLRDDRDSFYWAADVVCRMMEFFGSKGSRAPGRIDRQTEEKILDMMWIYSKDHSRLAEAETVESKTWHLHGSENHHIQSFSTLWHFAKFLKDDERYKNRPYDDGKTAAEHYRTWTEYIKTYLLERARKGLFVEIASKGYGIQTIKGIYNFHDFAEDSIMKRRAGYLLDLFWATWAEEQLDGVRGGGKTRVYQGLNSQIAINDPIRDLAWFYLGIGNKNTPSGNSFTIITSPYRMPTAVMDIALDAAGRGNYELRQRCMGLCEAGTSDALVCKMRTDFGGIIRYSYGTPDFIMGTLMHEARPYQDWAAISAQNHWNGIIFDGHPNARIFPQCTSNERKQRTRNQHWSVQQKGTLIVQKLKPGFSHRALAMRVWFAADGLTNRAEKAGWVFVESKGAYAAARPVSGTYQWQASDTTARGEWLLCSEEMTPVIFEAARKSDFKDYAAFQTAVTARPLKLEKDRLSYQGLAGDQFTLYPDQTRLPEINGTPVNLAPSKVFDSPFVQSDWNSGVVTIQKGDRKIVLDFN